MLKGDGIPLNVHEIETSGELWEVQLSITFDSSVRVTVIAYSTLPNHTIL